MELLFLSALGIVTIALAAPHIARDDDSHDLD